MADIIGADVSEQTVADENGLHASAGAARGVINGADGEFIFLGPTLEIGPPDNEETAEAVVGNIPDVSGLRVFA